MTIHVTNFTHDDFLKILKDEGTKGLRKCFVCNKNEGDNRAAFTAGEDPKHGTLKVRISYFDIDYGSQKIAIPLCNICAVMFGLLSLNDDSDLSMYA